MVICWKPTPLKDPSRRDLYITSQGLRKDDRPWQTLAQVDKVYFQGVSAHPRPRSPGLQIPACHEPPGRGLWAERGLPRSLVSGGASWCGPSGEVSDPLVLWDPWERACSLSSPRWKKAQKSVNPSSPALPRLLLSQLTTAVCCT